MRRPDFALALALILAVPRFAGAQQAACVVAGPAQSLVTARIAPAGGEPFEVSIDASVTLSVEPRDAPAPARLHLRAPLAFDADATANLRYQPAEPVPTPWGMLGDDARAEAVGPVHSRAITARVRVAGLAIETVELPCESLRPTGSSGGGAVVALPGQPVFAMRGARMDLWTAPRGAPVATALPDPAGTALFVREARRGRFWRVRVVTEGPSRLVFWVLASAMVRARDGATSAWGSGSGANSTVIDGVFPPGTYRGPATVLAGAAVAERAGGAVWARVSTGFASADVIAAPGEGWVSIERVPGVDRLAGRAWVERRFVQFRTAP